MYRILFIGLVLNLLGTSSRRLWILVILWPNSIHMLCLDSSVVFKSW